MMRPWSVTAWLKAAALRKVDLSAIESQQGHALSSPGRRSGMASSTLTRSIKMAPMNPKYIEPAM